MIKQRPHLLPEQRVGEEGEADQRHSFYVHLLVERIAVLVAGRENGRPESGQGLRRAAFVALLGVAALVVAGVLLALVDDVRARGLALDLVGAVAAAAVLVTVLVTARRQPPQG